MVEIFNFDEIIDRKKTNSFKWDFLKNIYGTDDLIPMWVADMDFKSPPQVIEALKKRAEHGVFGYTFRPESYYKAMINWIKEKYDWEIKENWISFTPGVVSGLKIAVHSFTKPGDNILIQTPVYHPFFDVIKNNGRNIAKNSLIHNSDNTYSIDYEDLEKKISDKNTKMFILCSPHNPIGKVWAMEDLIKMANLCKKYNVIIISDEIHSDLVYKKNTHFPLASISDEIADITVTFYAPSKTFNIAGLETANAVISNKYLRNEFNNTIERYGTHMSNIFGIEALMNSYKYGNEWLEELLIYLESNIDYVISFFSEKLPEVKIPKPDSTYLLWLDFRRFGDENKLQKIFIEKAKVGLEKGSVFGTEGLGFFRMNVGCPKAILEKACNNIYEAFKNYGGEEA